ncbi:MAG: glycosyltransferase family 2 protein, partial [Alphaproteobacteria bacterium]|nr:glycosyltransferase family 2 protein [Alphaproteobacteria bacterium]
QIDPALTSVVMVSHYTGPALDRAIAAVLAQTAPVELIVVNNGNPPDIEARLAARAKEEPRLQLLTGHGNAGLGKGCNMGAEVARGGHLLFMRADSLPPPDAVARMRKLAEGGKHPVLLGARIVDENGIEIRESRRPFLTPILAFLEYLNAGRYVPKFRLYLHNDPVPEAPVPVPAVSGAFLFVAAKDFKRIKGFSEGCFTAIADMDFCLQHHRAEGKTYFVPGVVVKRAGTSQPPDYVLLERKRARSESHYFHENFGHAYTQPALWVLDVLLWGRFGLRFLHFRRDRARAKLAVS